MSESGSAKQRDADRTREAILSAAERQFAERGFQATTMGSIGSDAGVSRSTAAYFFGNKNDLYGAVLARVIQRASDAMTDAYAHTGLNVTIEQAVSGYVAVFVDFLARDHAFVRLIQREALEEVSRVADFFRQLVDEALLAFSPAAEQAGISPQRLLLDVISLCWYPFAHEHTLLPALGMTPRDSAFLDAHKQHVVRLVTTVAPWPR